jgi:hypothetical protein
MKRRGVLGGLAALGFGSSGAVQNQAAGQAIGGGFVGDVGMAIGRGAATIAGDVACGAPSGGPNPLVALFHRRMDEEFARRSRVQARLALTGGVPAGVVVCRSWKPWFAAAVTERWMDEHLPPPRLVERAIYRAVFGRDMDG